jgi:hypothetical protein
VYKGTFIFACWWWPFQDQPNHQTRVLRYSYTNHLEASHVTAVKGNCVIFLSPLLDILQYIHLMWQHCSSSPPCLSAIFDIFYPPSWPFPLLEWMFLYLTLIIAVTMHLDSFVGCWGLADEAQNTTDIWHCAVCGILRSGEQTRIESCIIQDSRIMVESQTKSPN